MKNVTVQEVEYVAYRLAKELMTWNEPIPDFASRFPNVLESCLATPLQTYGGKSLYPGFISKAAILFYLMVKNHPFKNGNKRIAVTTLLLFLYINKKWLKMDKTQLYRFAKWIAESDTSVKDDAINAIKAILTKYIV